MPPLLLEFGKLDWGIVLGYLVITTIIGERLAGKQATIRDFFLGGRKLPWWAVAGSNIATEISAVTFVSVPFVVYRDGGNFTYLQFGLIGSLLARIIVGYVLVPAYFQREIYSPYDYMANRLGSGVKNVCSALFAFGGILAQGSRVYLTAIVLRLAIGESVLRPLEEATGLSSLALSVLFIGIVATIWTLLGGITTVIWTDVILFFVFLLGGSVALWAIASRLDGGLSEIFEVGRAANKFQFLNWSRDPTEAYTVWCAAIAVTWGNVGAFGTDQLMAQRMFCCKDEKAARWAVIGAAFGQVFTAIVMLVGVGLYAFYAKHPLSGSSLASVEDKGDSIFPIFILNEVPTGLSGLIIAGIFAAAISSLDGILSALSQTAMATLYVPFRRKRLAARGITAPDDIEDRHEVAVGRRFVVLAGIVLSVVALGMDVVAKNYKSILDLALSLATYAQGGLLAGFLLAFLPLDRDGRGLVYSVPLSCLAVFALNWQPDVAVDEDAFWPTAVCLLGGALIVALFAVFEWGRHSRRRQEFAVKILALAAGAAIVVWLNRSAHFQVGFHESPGLVEPRPRYAMLAFPWHAPIGCVIAFALGWLLGNPRDKAPLPTAAPAAAQP